MDAVFNESLRRFVAEHASDDPAALLLARDRWPGVDVALAADCIASRRKLRGKCPRWAEPDILCPLPLSAEQSSSERTARYKAALVRRLAGERPLRVADLTGGLGVDCEAMAQRFAQVTYVERQERLCQLARHNFTILGAHNIRVVHAEAEEYLHSMAPVDAIYIDPSRRDHAGRRTHDIADCAPNVAELAHVLLAKTPTVMVAFAHARR